MSCPAGWAQTTLGELLPLIYGKGLVEASRDANGTVPVYGSSGVVGLHSQALVDGETLVVGRKGTIGAVYHSRVPCWVIDTAYYLNPSLPIKWRFFFYLLQHLQLDKLDRSTAVPGLSRDDYSKVEIVVAPEPEQDRIVAEIEKQFTRLDDATAALKRVQANLKRYRASVLKAACEGRLVPTEAELARKENRSYEPASELLKRILAERRAKWESDQLQKMIAAGKPPKNEEWKKRYKEPAPLPDSLPELPSGWCWTTLDAVTFVTKLAGFEFTKFVRYSSDGDLPVIKAENVGMFGFKETDFSFVSSDSVRQLSRSRVIPKDVLMVFIGAHLGYVCLVPNDREFFLGPNVALIRSQSQFLEPSYLELYLRSPLAFRFTRSVSKATAQGSISMNQIRLLPIAIPPGSEQRRIIEGVDRRQTFSERTSESVQREFLRTQQLRQSCLKAAFSGQLVPQDPNDEPASVLLERIRAQRAALATNNGNQKATQEAGTANGQRRRRAEKLAQGVSPGKG